MILCPSLLPWGLCWLLVTGLWLLLDSLFPPSGHRYLLLMAISQPSLFSTTPSRSKPLYIIIAHASSLENILCLAVNIYLCDYLIDGVCPPQLRHCSVKIAVMINLYTPTQLTSSMPVLCWFMEYTQWLLLTEYKNELCFSWQRSWKGCYLHPAPFPYSFSILVPTSWTLWLQFSLTYSLPSRLDTKTRNFKKWPRNQWCSLHFRPVGFSIKLVWYLEEA